MVKYLVSRSMDPILSIATGIFAYYIYESDPKNALERPSGRKLHELFGRYWRNELPHYSLYSGPKALIKRETNLIENSKLV